MIILEKDFKIQSDGSCFTLYFLKTKKEIKEDSKINTAEIVDVFKVRGYYTTLFSAIRAAFRWRMDEKYPFKEILFKESYIQYRKSIVKLECCLGLIYKPIIDLKYKTYAEHKQFLDRIQE